MSVSSKSAWFVPSALLALSVIPILGGLVRLADLLNGSAVIPENARFLAAPVPIALHVLGAIIFCIFGAFQFSSNLREKAPVWHRTAGRVLVPAGVVAGLAGLWMTLFYPIHAAMQGELLFWVRVAVGCAMVASIFQAVVAVIKRNIAEHRAWMIRAYAMAQGAGTQVLVLLPVMVFSGEALGLTRDLLMTLAWFINITIAEWIIRR